MAGFKYIKKVRTASGKWRYIYGTRSSGRTTPTPQFGMEDYTSDRIRNTANLRRAYKTAKNVYDAWSRWSEGNRRAAVKVAQAVGQKIKDAYDDYQGYQEYKRQKQNGSFSSGGSASNSAASGNSYGRQRHSNGRTATVRKRTRQSGPYSLTLKKKR